MEGSRHEKMYLILTSYIIGFVTAFIAFGVTKTEPLTQVIVVQNEKSQTSVMPEAPVKEPTSLIFSDEGLFAITQGYKRLLSVNKSSLGASVLTTTSNSGFYTNVYEAQVSPNGEFIYYCEQLDASDDSCYPYIYRVGDDTLYPLVHDGEKYVSPIADHAVAWTSDNLLTINGYLSENEASPWELMQSEVVTTDDLLQVQ